MSQLPGTQLPADGWRHGPGSGAVRRVWRGGDRGAGVAQTDAAAETETETAWTRRIQIHRQFSLRRDVRGARGESGSGGRARSSLAAHEKRDTQSHELHTQ